MQFSVALRVNKIDQNQNVYNVLSDIIVFMWKHTIYEWIYFKMLFVNL